MDSTNTTPHPTARQLAQARFLGADAALTAASWLTMSESDARSILDDVDPEVLDRYPEPNLSGEWADDPTPQSVYEETRPERCALRTSALGSQVVCGDCGSDCECYVCTYDSLDATVEAWEEGRDAVWSDALQAHALRLLGDIPEALQLEQANEAYADGRRRAALETEREAWSL